MYTNIISMNDITFYQEPGLVFTKLFRFRIKIRLTF